MGLERSRIDVQGLADEPIGLGIITALAGKDAKHVQRVELPCVPAQNDMVERFRPAEIPALVSRDRMAEDRREPRGGTRSGIRLMVGHPWCGPAFAARTRTSPSA